jgi:hypothetical protein
LEKTGKQTIAEVWPELELYMHGGVSFTPYKEQFQKLIGKEINYLEMYNASEGFLEHKQHHWQTACCSLPIMVYFMSSCL